MAISLAVSNLVSIILELHFFLFDATRLVENLKSRGIKIGIATSIIKQLWQEAEIYPTQRNNQLILSEEQKRSLALFGAN